MQNLDIVQIDAFTVKAYSGNPCAVVFGADHLSDSSMQKIAQEMNLSETAFILRTNKADFRARYFTPSYEIPLAGHPTIATIQALITNGQIPIEEKKFTVHLELQVVVITVEIEVTDSNQYLITMSQMKPEFLKTYDPESVLSSFGLTQDDMLENYPIMTVSTGTPQLMIPIKSLESLKKAKLNIEKYEILLSNSDFMSSHLFVVQGVTEEGDTFARHLSLPTDIAEDPFTGSATGGMAAYLWHHNLIKNSKLVAEQGHWMGRPGKAFVEVIGTSEEIETVKVGGYAAHVFQGKIICP